MATATETTEGLALSPEQQSQLAEILGVEGDLDAETLLARVTESRQNEATEPTEPPAPAPGPGEPDTPTPSTPPTEPVEPGVQLSETEYYGLVSDASAGAAAAEELRQGRRDRTIEGALRDGRIVPGQRDEFVRLYDEDEDMAVRVLNTLLPDQARAVSYGAEDEPEFTDAEEALYREFSELSGVEMTTLTTDAEGRAA